MMLPMKIVQADNSTLEQTAYLFDLYRQFYKQPSDLSAARAFISARLVNQDSVIYLALTETGEGMGFTQLFPSFSSVAMQTVYTLNDLYVDGAHRKKGVAKALMNTAKAFAQKNNAHAIKLATAKDNHQAKALYDQLGYKRIDSFDYYSLAL
jgi:ribosomal protein S18 acetylase RimI-like enzyme